MQKLVRIGRITRPFGLRGHLRCFIEPAFVHRLPALPVFFLTYRGALLPFATEEWSLQPSGHALFRPQGIGTRTEAQQFAGIPLHIEEHRLKKAPRPSGPATWLGFALQDEKYGPLGNLHDVLLLPHHPVGVFHYRGKEVLFPLCTPIVVAADGRRRILYLRLPDGLLQAYVPQAD